MVELGVQTANFGKPFHERVDGTGRVKPGPPEPRFPGISPTAFDPSGQLQAFSDILKKEKNTLCKGQEAEEFIASLRGPASDDPAARLGDLMPGYGSLNSYYTRLGYVKHPISGNMVPPEAVDQPSPLDLLLQSKIKPARSSVSSLAPLNSSQAFKRSTSSIAPQPPRDPSRLSAAAPFLSDVSTNIPRGGSTCGPEAMQRSVSAPNGLTPETARVARLRAMLRQSQDLDSSADACQRDPRRSRKKKSPFR